MVCPLAYELTPIEKGGGKEKDREPSHAIVSILSEVNGYHFICNRHFYKGKQLYYCPFRFLAYRGSSKIGLTLEGKYMYLF